MVMIRTNTFDYLELLDDKKAKEEDKTYKIKDLKVGDRCISAICREALPMVYLGTFFAATFEVPYNYGYGYGRNRQKEKQYGYVNDTPKRAFFAYEYDGKVSVKSYPTTNKHVKELYSSCDGIDALEIYKAKTEYLGESYEEMKRKVEDLKLENEKVRNITTRLTSQYISEKERSENFAKDYNLLTRRFGGIVDQNTEYLKKVKILENELEVKILESSNLTEKIKGFGVGSTNALENALSDKISMLEKKLENNETIEITLKKENTLLMRDLKKYKDTIGSLLKT
jgi:cell division protein FtsB